MAGILEEEAEERAKRRQPMPTDDDWKPRNAIEEEIVGFSDRQRWSSTFARTINEVATRMENQAAGEIFDDDVVDAHLMRQHDEYKANLLQQQRMLQFLDNVESTLTDPEVECSVCMEELQGERVTIFPCFHSFCSDCVLGVFGGRATATCPMCRLNVSRRELCSFVITLPGEKEHSHDGEDGAEIGRASCRERV